MNRIIEIGIAAFGAIVTGGFAAGAINLAQSPIVIAIGVFGLLGMVFTSMSFVTERVQQ